MLIFVKINNAITNDTFIVKCEPKSLYKVIDSVNLCVFEDVSVTVCQCFRHIDAYSAEDNFRQDFFFCIQYDVYV